MTVYDYDEYLDFLKAIIKNNSKTRGYLTELAQAAGCQKSYLSQVIRGMVHFTPEHAMKLALFWELSEIESDYFIQLVHLGRTSFQPLKNKIKDQLKVLKEQKDNMTMRFKQSSFDDEAKQMLYYSTWIMAAIHVMVDIERLRTSEAIAKHLNLSTEIVKNQLEKLEQLGLVKRHNLHWLPTGKGLHLPKGSVFTTINHQNWRDRALIDSQNPKADSVHYTSVQTLSLKDFEVIKENILKFIDQQRKIIAPSKEEEVVCFTCDWFKI